MSAGARRAVCSEKDPTEACAARIEAIRRGEFFWNGALGGWTFAVGMDAYHRFTPRARYVFGERGQEAKRALDGTLYVRGDCPWCGEPLPDFDTMRRASPAADGNSGQDGGE